jgi:hypothetical protein
MKITIEDSRYSHPQLQGPVECLDGARACPPEDVGGIEGFFDFCEAVLDPAHEDHEQVTQWYAGFPWYTGAFNPEAYDVVKVNDELMKYLRWSRDRSLTWEVVPKEKVNCTTSSISQKSTFHRILRFTKYGERTKEKRCLDGFAGHYSFQGFD